MIQEEAPFKGTHQEQTEFVARWQAIVEDKLADKHQKTNVRDSLAFPRKITNLLFLPRDTSTQRSRIAEKRRASPTKRRVKFPQGFLMLSPPYKNLCVMLQSGRTCR